MKRASPVFQFDGWIQKRRSPPGAVRLDCGIVPLGMLEANSLKVWLVRLNHSATQVPQWRDALSIGELEKADRFHFESHRLHYVASHFALRTVLGQCLGVSPGTVRFAVRSEPELAASAPLKGASGKPTLESSHGSNLRFNLSHTEGAALIAVAEGVELGIDIESQRPIDDLAGVARSVMSQEEFVGWERRDPEERLTAFYRLWTRKEAYIKATGLGLSASLQQITVPVSSGILLQSTRVEDSAGKGVWSVRDIEVPSGYFASLSSEGYVVPKIEFIDIDSDHKGRPESSLLYGSFH
jgi:4'-phosphopantetheinyl transferase